MFLFEQNVTQNIRHNLRPNTGSDRYQAGKTKASSSPLEGQSINKKQREDDSEHLENSYMELTPSPIVIQSPSILNDPCVNENALASNTNINTELPTSLTGANPPVTIRAENHEIIEQPVAQCD